MGQQLKASGSAEDPYESRAPQSMQEPPHPICRKGFDYELRDDCREVSKIFRRLSRCKIPQNTGFLYSLRALADELRGPARAGHWKFLRQCVR